MHKKTQENTCVGFFFVMKLLSKKETGTGFFPAHFAKFLRTLLILQSNCKQLLKIFCVKLRALKLIQN